MGRVGFDTVQGKCTTYITDHATMAISDLVRCVIVIASYGFIFQSLRLTDETQYRSQRKALMILIMTFIVFILPHSVFEYMQNNEYFKIPYKVIMNFYIHLWYYCNYFINFFIYVIYWRRVREGMRFMFRDLFRIRKKNRDLHQEETTDAWRIQFDNIWTSQHPVHNGPWRIGYTSSDESLII